LPRFGQEKIERWKKRRKEMKRNNERVKTRLTLAQAAGGAQFRRRGVKGGLVEPCQFLHRLRADSERPERDVRLLEELVELAMHPWVAERQEELRRLDVEDLQEMAVRLGCPSYLIVK
jgi:hypothetical protein